MVWCKLSRDLYKNISSPLSSTPIPEIPLSRIHTRYSGAGKLEFTETMATRSRRSQQENHNGLIQSHNLRGHQHNAPSSSPRLGVVVPRPTLPPPPPHSSSHRHHHLLFLLQACAGSWPHRWLRISDHRWRVRRDQLGVVGARVDHHRWRRHHRD